MKGTRDLEPYSCESKIILDKGSNGVMGKSYQMGGRIKKLLSGNTLQNIGERNFDLNASLQTKRGCENGGRMIGYDPLFMQALFNSVDVRGNIYLMAKDQHGCRFLQKKFDEGSFEDVQLIFDEIIDHVVELMTNPFGNYLVQKLFDVCNEEQRMKIIHVMTKNRGELVKISLNAHGTRVVQKLIESLTTRKQITMVIRALEPGFLDLMRDLNGNHVIQRCLHCLSSEDNKFIFDAATMHCVEIATQRHGCCVLQRCIDHSYGEHWQKLIDKICSNALVLAQDPFGELCVALYSEFSSHVVEKCLNYIEESHPIIVCELLSVPHLSNLCKTLLPNYVLQSALEKTKGALYESLVLAIRPHSMLHTNPYCKKIFSRGFTEEVTLVEEVCMLFSNSNVVLFFVLFL
ncbi:putative pumilio-like protein 7 chloroplastic [Bienertia sinuspersici]